MVIETSFPFLIDIGNYDKSKRESLDQACDYYRDNETHLLFVCSNIHHWYPHYRFGSTIEYLAEERDMLILQLIRQLDEEDFQRTLAYAIPLDYCATQPSCHEECAFWRQVISVLPEIDYRYIVHSHIMRCVKGGSFARDNKGWIDHVMSVLSEYSFDPELEDLWQDAMDMEKCMRESIQNAQHNAQTEGQWFVEHDEFGMK